MKAVVLEDTRKIVVRKVKDAEMLATTDVLLRLTSSAICGTADANLHGPSIHAFDNFVNGAPPMAPLLFQNLMVLGIIALWQFRNSSVLVASRAV